MLEVKALIDRVWEDTNNIEHLNIRYGWLKYNIRKYTLDYYKQRSKTIIIIINSFLIKRLLSIP